MVKRVSCFRSVAFHVGVDFLVLLVLAELVVIVDLAVVELRFDSDVLRGGRPNLAFVVLVDLLAQLLLKDLLVQQVIIELRPLAHIQDLGVPELPQEVTFVNLVFFNQFIK